MQNSLSVTQTQMSGKDLCTTKGVQPITLHCAMFEQQLWIGWSVMGVGGTGEESLAARSGGLGGEDGAVTRVL